MRVKDRVAIVTGAARGIGEGIALRLAEEGANVVLVDLLVEQAQRVASRIEAMGRRTLVLRANVSSPGDVEQLARRTVEAFGRIDILVNNAGITRDALLPKMTEEMWDQVLAVNLKGVFLCSQAVARYMMDQRYGKIVSIASRGMLGNVGQANYTASKAGVAGLTRTMALELAPYGINVNAVAPGLVETPMTKTIPPKVLERGLKTIPLGRVGTPQDIANAVLFLCSDEASYITGQVLFVDGGRSIAAAPML